MDTTSLRHTLWFFVQTVFGVCNEDLRYEHVLKLLSVEQRSFLKVCASRPFDLVAYRPTICREIFAALGPSEVVRDAVILLNIYMGIYYLNQLGSQSLVICL